MKKKYVIIITLLLFTISNLQAQYGNDYKYSFRSRYSKEKTIDILEQYFIDHPNFNPLTCPLQDESMYITKGKVKIILFKGKDLEMDYGYAIVNIKLLVSLRNVFFTYELVSERNETLFDYLYANPEEELFTGPNLTDYDNNIITRLLLDEEYEDEVWAQLLQGEDPVENYIEEWVTENVTDGTYLFYVGVQDVASPDAIMNNELNFKVIKDGYFEQIWQEEIEEWTAAENQEGFQEQAKILTDDVYEDLIELIEYKR